MSLDERTTYAWVIERNDGGGGVPAYWIGKTLEGFSEDANEAVRFLRKRDALTIMHWLLSDAGRAFCHVREHGWTDTELSQ